MVRIRVIVNGTFDVLHRGHLELLLHARAIGKEVLVAIDSDRRVHELKGEGRPFNSQEDRAFHLKNLHTVDEVRIFDSDRELMQIMDDFEPHYMVKGSDYKDKPIIVRSDCEVVFFDLVRGYSSTKLINVLTQQHKL